ncbi:Coenzyme PQQ synthesis protein D (PqqD) [Seinonella peptonophila]|uniref:Coenzyme PQQ synthesis protein D (PqqD) n=1 Tax=Seinonella peptonophila TaxID=112248 RepID=A0A1M4VCY2_9BACL|nr:PqqD family protein [Seinonella peptonophila]SHE66831.1 Coenzyme PQQ synthesis protein D (PqqD) [Seinonella peptonophila]
MSLYQVNNWIKISALYDEMSVLDARNGVYYQLNKSAQIMWNAILNEKNDEESLKAIYRQVDGDKEEIQNEYQDFKKQLINEGWIKRNEG